MYNLQESKFLWIHHWVVLQFLHEHFVVGCNTDLSGPDEDNGRVYNFKHDNWSKMIKSVDRSYEDQYTQIYGYQPRLSLVWLRYTRRPVVDDEDDHFELAVPVGDGDACDASDKVGKKSTLKSTGSTTEHRTPTKKSWVQEVKERDRRESEGVIEKKMNA